MSPQLIENLRKLHARSTDEEDRDLLGKLLAAHEAAQVAANLADEPAPRRMKTCKNCKEPCAVLVLSKDGRCPDCVLIWMHDLFSRKRADAIKNGW